MTVGRLPTDAAAAAAALAVRWDAVQARIAAAAASAGRDPAAIRVVAVTKGFGVEVVRAAVAIGLQTFGENRVQEAEPKIAVAPDAEWHLVGHLQSNKARRAVAAFSAIDGVDSLPLLMRLDAVAAELRTAPVALLQVNLTEAIGQHGFAPMDLAAAGADSRLSAVLDALRHVSVAGLMGIGPFTTDPSASRAAFAALRRMRDQLERETGRPLPELSMGMSGDLEPAIAEGATQVRVGTALFGPRVDAGQP